MKSAVTIENKRITVSGRFLKTARLEAEYYEWVENAEEFIGKLKSSGIQADVFTFLQEIGDRKQRHDFRCELDSIAVLPITSYENWWKNQINDKTRNMVRKAQKTAVELRAVPFNDDLVRGIMEIYNESPIRQGKPFKHYRKDFETIKATHITFLDQSEFVGAFYKNELIGFIKLVHGPKVSSLMQIISKIGHRDKAPTNALIAKAVEICGQRGVSYLHYGIWGRGGGLGDFKKHHAFEQFDLPRYSVPLTPKGKLMLGLNLHRNASEYLPEKCLNFLLNLRRRWTLFRYRNQKVVMGQ